MITQFQYGILADVLQILIPLSPIILAFILFLLFWPVWVNYVRSDFFFSLKYAVLEIKLPKEMMKSPLAMEIFLNAIHNTADGSNFAQYWRGEKRPSYSLEIVSIEGLIKFMIWTEDRRKSGVMSALYSQFPGIEVKEVEDYTHGFVFDPKLTKLWGAEFKLTKPDPYPIKTYVDYGLDKDPKEEFKVDPLTPMLEFLGNIGKDQQIWVQYMVRAHIKDQIKPGTLFKKADLYRDEAEKIINDIMLRDPKTKKNRDTDEIMLAGLSDGEKEIIKSIERNMNKLAFDVGIRGIYMAKKELFDKPNGIGGMISSFKHFNTENLNGFKPNGDKWSAKFSGSPWEDYKNIRANRQSRLVLEAYRRRCYFYDPFIGKPLVLSTEELATIYHFPGSVAITPGLTRIPSKKAEAPSNLPI